MDESLRLAHLSWLPLLEEGENLCQNHQPKAAIAPLSEAIRISASYHPLFHFWESGLNLEAALLSTGEIRQRHLKRALFLHHDNASALALQNGASVPPYPLMSLCTPLTIDQGEIAALWQVAKEQQCANTYINAIAQLDETHKTYHQLAAMPWLARARAFILMAEISLAQNDIRRGKDLNRHHPEWKELEAALCIA